MLQRFFTTTLLLFIVFRLSAQDFTDNQEKYHLKITKLSKEIIIDGLLQESAWDGLDMATDFWDKSPVTKRGADPKTEVKMAYNDHFLYVGITCYDTDKYIIQTLKRDVDYWQSDGIAIVIDPVNQRSNGFIFGVSPVGVQMEGQLSGSGGGGSGIDRNWDNKWFSATKTFPDHWTVEMAIPFNTLRYKSSSKEWGINFIRNNSKENEYHTWAPVPQQFDGVNLNYTGKLIWDQAPPKAKGNITLVPYITGAATQDLLRDEKSKYKFNAGLDAKVALSSSLNLDLTINPDFSQVEIDEQITNLTRFSIFLPEKRNFFLENADIFSKFGIPPIRPFFSRRIGLDEQGKTVPILMGARLSGNITDRTRIGVLSMQTRETDVYGGQNYTTVAAHRRLFKNSLIKGIFVSRQGFADGKLHQGDYGRNAGVEMRLVSNDNKWNSWGSYHHSFKQGVSDKNFFYEYGGGYFGKKFNFLTDMITVKENYFADVGFVSRVASFYRDTIIRSGFTQNFTFMDYFIYPANNNIINLHRFGFESFILFRDGGVFGDRFNRLRYFIDFKNSSSIKFRIDNQASNLIAILSITGDEVIQPGKYTYTQVNLEYQSDQRKSFVYEANIRAGGFYDGELTTYQLGISYRQQPWGNFGIKLEKNDIRHPTLSKTASFLLLKTRFEINFSQKLYWTTFLQYSIQGERFNINSRLQWRFSPMSDFFIVYTNNYDILNDKMNPFTSKTNGLLATDRALVFKLNYWLNL